MNPLIILIGVIIIALIRGVMKLQELNYLMKYGIRTEAVVIENQEEHKSIFEDNDDTGYDHRSMDQRFSPILEFEDNKGKSVIVRKKMKATYTKHKVGKKVELVYDPENSSVNEVNLKMKRMILIISNIFGVVLLIFLLLKVSN